LIGRRRISTILAGSAVVVALAVPSLASAQDVSTTTTTAPPNVLQPGDPCSPEEGVPDCIDPDGDGQYVYLIGGSDCIDDNPGNPAICEDLDGDGTAGFPDQG